VSAVKKARPGDANKTALLLMIRAVWGVENVVCEHVFHPVRMWRFDYAIPSLKIAIEYHGHAGFIAKRKQAASGHSTIKGLTNDCEKLNNATALGWRVLAFTALHFRAQERKVHKLTAPLEMLRDVAAGKKGGEA